MDSDIPEFCGFDCPYSDFPPPDSAGLCRTMAAVYCKKLRTLVNKNAPCAVRRQARKGSSKRSSRGRGG